MKAIVLTLIGKWTLLLYRGGRNQAYKYLLRNDKKWITQILVSLEENEYLVVSTDSSGIISLGTTVEPEDDTPHPTGFHLHGKKTDSKLRQSPHTAVAFSRSTSAWFLVILASAGFFPLTTTAALTMCTLHRKALMGDSSFLRACSHSTSRPLTADYTLSYHVFPALWEIESRKSIRDQPRCVRLEMRASML